ncbi:hypothetical protein EDC90_1005172 [Martelella mediterranea]|uniref:Uncharacterized protein n=1 Tax=Martelella mediterranea TaxID=293089 RepID=A0A4R3P0Q1_9HYPH|nr:hypothetical protein EDC90_1005172 [Martelella mediterranea]
MFPDAENIEPNIIGKLHFLHKVLHPAMCLFSTVDIGGWIDIGEGEDSEFHCTILLYSGLSF